MMNGYEIWNVTSPSSCAVVPSRTAPSRRFENSRNSETPRMISGITNEKSMKKFAPAAGRPRHRSIPIANAVPSGTAISIVISESRNVWNIADRSAGSCQTESNASWYHHRREKPCHALRDLPALKEKTMAIRTGRIDHAR